MGLLRKPSRFKEIYYETITLIDARKSAARSAHRAGPLLLCNYSARRDAVAKLRFAPNRPKAVRFNVASLGIFLFNQR